MFEAAMRDNEQKDQKPTNKELVTR
jgi:hypothetical protein